MLVHLRTRFGFPAPNNLFSSTVNPLPNQRPKLPQTLTLTLQMVTHASSSSRRPMCSSCSKPARLCLCTRLRTPRIQNSVGVTILQHSLEKKHPLNSTRIATLGLENLHVVTVSDVNFEARFLMRLLEPDSGLGLASSEIKNAGFCGSRNHQTLDDIHRSSSQTASVVDSEFGRFLEYPDEKDTSFTDSTRECSFRNGFGGVRISLNVGDDTDVVRNWDSLMDEPLTSEAKHDSTVRESSIGAKGTFVSEETEDYLVRRSDLEAVSDCCTLNGGVLDEETEVAQEAKLSQPCFDPLGAVPIGFYEPAIAFTMEKYGLITSLTHNWMPLTQWQKPKFDQLLASPVALDALRKGFVVKKLQKKQLNGNGQYEECEEFDITVPPGSVLLFPSEKSAGVEALDFEVKNLIVLDGTWAKAKRVYNENPWLKILPHLKLDSGKLSLYSEVRHQPSVGCLSTIESTVYALKAVGDNPKGLDDLLNVFESMVGDQRRCKDERLSKASEL